MARPTKQGIDYFPSWNPRHSTVTRMNSLDRNVRIKAIRCSSSSFIRKSDVRDFIFNRDDNKCVICGAKEKLEIDHIQSVYSAAFNTKLLETLNTESNLRTLCASCNRSLSLTGISHG